MEDDLGRSLTVISFGHLYNVNYNVKICEFGGPPTIKLRTIPSQALV